MPATITLIIDGRPHRVRAGATVASAVLLAHGPGFRRSVSGEARGPLCGMGICFECRLTIDGRPQQISCQTIGRDGMEVATDGGS